MPGHKRMSAEEAVGALTPIVGYAPTREQVAVAFLDVDQAELRAKAEKRVRWERWDKKSPVNGVPAARVLASRNDYEGGEIFLVYVDDALVYFQPHHPEKGGAMDKKAMGEAADAQVADVVDHISSAAVVDALVASLPVAEPVVPEPVVLTGAAGTPVARRGSR